MRVFAGQPTLVHPCIGGPKENIAYEFVFASLAVPRISCSSYLDD